MNIYIDGGSGTGKTSLGRALAERYRANLFHMDDFFLPFEMRTAERLAEPGGNVHYERVKAELLDKLDEGVPFSYRVYDCSGGTYRDSGLITPKRFNIIEGVYSLHPYFGERGGIKVLLTAPLQTRLERIELRGGREALERFKAEWIPLEDRYFEAFRIAETDGLLIYNT